MATEDLNWDLIIIGGGAAGMTAGIYGARYGLKTLILEGKVLGGQQATSPGIENYPGFTFIMGMELATKMKDHVKHAGAAIKEITEVKSITRSEEGGDFILDTRKGAFHAKAVIFATGGEHRHLNVPGETEFSGRGISYCATCDGDFFEDKEVIVVGGGNSALEEAVTLTRYASKVTIVHQFDHFQAFEHAVQEAKNNPKIDFIMESEPREFSGNGVLQKVAVENLQSGTMSELNIDGVFIFVGYLPNTDSLKGILSLNQYGEIPVDTDMKTNIPGVFAAGDCIAKKYRQVTTAVAEGTIASLSALEYLRT